MRYRWNVLLLTLLLVANSGCGKQPLPTQPATDVAAAQSVASRSLTPGSVRHRRSGYSQFTVTFALWLQIAHANSGPDGLLPQARAGHARPQSSA